MHTLQGPLISPRLILFDWHATLVDTLDAMYIAIDEVLPLLRAHRLIQHLVKPSQCRNSAHAALVRHVRDHAKLDPKSRSERRYSRTDIFEMLFADHETAKSRAHQIFDQAYGRLFGQVQPMEAGIPALLRGLRARGLQLGVLSNRKREYMAHELWAVENGRWMDLFDIMVCGDEVEHRKPAPDLILKALAGLEHTADASCWYVGDSLSDLLAARRAGICGILYNSGGWPEGQVDSLLVDAERQPQQPDAVITHLAELLELLEHSSPRRN